MNKKQIIKQWNNLFKLQKGDRIYFKVVENFKGENWLIAFGKDIETNKEYYITTHNVHASEVMDISGGAKADAEFFAEVMNLSCNGKFKKMKEFIKKLTSKSQKQQ